MLTLEDISKLNYLTEREWKHALYTNCVEKTCILSLGKIKYAEKYFIRPLGVVTLTFGKFYESKLRRFISRLSVERQDIITNWVHC